MQTQVECRESVNAMSKRRRGEKLLLSPPARRTHQRSALLEMPRSSSPSNRLYRHRSPEASRLAASMPTHRRFPPVELRFSALNKVFFLDPHKTTLFQLQ